MGIKEEEGKRKERKFARKKKKKVVVKTDIVARMTHVAKEKLGCRGTRHQGAWVSQEGIRAGSSDCS